ncbi:hypothetical protein LEP1GSC050_2289 [Leptospira broomii serovar Hurstbridge str. 5399]|uniref:Uncharacterized protein n=1 Tax=Leptospira broomii serovar Hurstbridge str. 5399 TaxID=1049789 RepID=T0FA32_9LEPT|nr:hypothetical protein LEP1GSC050_2289 [Leptospira broomii serovar Hurstbridge str. 5399]
MTLGTVYTALNVSGVIELNMIGKIMNLNPLKRLLLLVSFDKIFNVGLLSCHHRVTIHTRRCVRNGCVSSRFHTRMTIAAIYLIVSGMYLMVKGYRLVWRIAHVFGGRKDQVGHRCNSNERNRKFQSFLIHS